MADFDFYTQAQKYYQKTPTIILGSGASAAFGLSGMGTLADHLISTVNTDSLEDTAVDSWDRFKATLVAGKDLESALHEVRLSPELTRQVVNATWNLLNPEDINVFNNSLHNPNTFPLAELISGLFRSAVKQIDIITTNYDRLAEYAVEQAGYHHYTGFSHGYRRLQAPLESLKAERVVRILKVHGSLDWFTSPIGDVIGLNQVTEIPNGHIPQIVTPGIEKYSTTYHEPFRSIIQMADESIRSNDSYLCIGFGFNDEHIQEKLIEKCVRDGGCITLITWEMSSAAKSFLLSGDAKNYLAIERGEYDKQSVIYSSEADGPIMVEEDFWSLSGFLNLVL